MAKTTTYEYQNIDPLFINGLTVYVLSVCSLLKTKKEHCSKSMFDSFEHLVILCSLLMRYEQGNDMAKIGFARVSSSQQDLTLQLTALEAAGCEKVFQGKHSGKADTNKAALDELLEYVRADDTVYVTKIDRFGRSLSQVLITLDILKGRGVNLIAIDQSINTNDDDPMSTAMVQLLGMFAEMERNFIASRTTEGKKASGNWGGRRPSLADEQKKEIQARLKAGESQNKLSKEYNVSRVTIARAGGYEK